MAEGPDDGGGYAASIEKGTTGLNRAPSGAQTRALKKANCARQHLTSPCPPGGTSKAQMSSGAPFLGQRPQSRLALPSDKWG